MQKYIIQNALEEITGGTTLYTLEKHSKKPIISTLSGRSSGVERNLAKVEVEGSNPFARSKNKVSSQKIDIDCNRVQ